MSALLLARSGAPHLLVERAAETGDALCGGFLSWRTLDTLAALGIAPERLNRDSVTRLRVFAGSRIAEAPLPRPARAVSRHRLDTVLLAHAATAGARIERGVTVAEATPGIARLRDGGEIETDALFLATGKHDLRGLARPEDARGIDPYLGLRVRLGPSPVLDRLVDNAIELHLVDGGYAGLDRQEDGTANLCMAIRRSRLTEAGTPASLLDQLGRAHPALGERLAWRRGEASDAVANIPYGWRQRTGTPGLFRLGDQAGVIPSLAGEGIGIAIASAIRAVQAYRAGGAAAAVAYQHRFATDLARPLAVAGAVRRVAEAPALAPALVRVAAVAPGLIHVIARLTRIGHSPMDWE